MLLSENKGGVPFDYNQIRVFTWNVRHRYETASLGSIRWAVSDPVDGGAEKPVQQVTKPRLSSSHFLLVIRPTGYGKWKFREV